MLDSRYSHDWTAHREADLCEIATTKKQSVDWVCERCGVQCLRPGEGKGLSTGVPFGDSEAARYRLSMAVHHCDYDPGNNSPSNLMALCFPCHLHYHRRQRGNVTPEQLSLEFC